MQAFNEEPGTLIRTPEGHITFWSAALERRYGYSAAEALGQTSHELLRASHWQARTEIEAILIARSEWTGGLIVHRADDQPVMVANHWQLHRTDDQALVTEMHADIVTPGADGGNELADVVMTFAQELGQPLAALGGYIAGTRRAVQPAWPDSGRVECGLSAATAQLDRAGTLLRRIRALGDTFRSPRLRELHLRLVTAAGETERLTHEAQGARAAGRIISESSVSARQQRQQARSNRNRVTLPDARSAQRALTLQSIQVFRRCLGSEQSGSLEGQTERLLRQLLAEEEAKLAALS